MPEADSTVTRAATGMRNRSLRSTMVIWPGGSQATVVLIWYVLRTTNCAGPPTARVLTSSSSGTARGGDSISKRSTLGLTHESTARQASERSGSSSASPSATLDAGHNSASVPSTEIRVCPGKPSGQAWSRLADHVTSSG